MSLAEFEKKFVFFCGTACIGCGVESTINKLKTCPIVRLDKFIELSLIETPAVVAGGLQKAVDDFVDDGFGKRMGDKIARTNN